MSFSNPPFLALSVGRGDLVKVVNLHSKLECSNYTTLFIKCQTQYKEFFSIVIISIYNTIPPNGSVMLYTNLFLILVKQKRDVGHNKTQHKNSHYNTH